MTNRLVMLLGRFRLSLAAIVACGFTPVPHLAPAAEEAEKEKTEPGAASSAPSGEALDRQLLEGLGEDFLPDLNKLPAPSPAQPPPDQPKTKQPQPTEPPAGDADHNAPAIDHHLGEDVVPGGEQHPLARIGRQMQSVEQRLAARDASQQTQQIQEEILAQLDELLKQRQRRPQSPDSGDSPQNRQASRRSDPQQAQPGDGQPGQNSQQPARDSTDRVDPGAAETAKAEDLDRILQQLWGHLPQRQREQLLQTSREQFLPKYELLIEQYFRRLSADAEEAPLR